MPQKKNKNVRIVGNIAFPALNRDGPHNLIKLIITIILNQRGNPIAPDLRMVDAIARYRIVESAREPPLTYVETRPKIGIDYHLTGHSFELALVLGDRIARSRPRFWNTCHRLVVAVADLCKVIVAYCRADVVAAHIVRTRAHFRNICRRHSGPIFATGCLPGIAGIVEEVGEFEEKVDLIFEQAPPGSLFVFPMKNCVGSVGDRLARLEAPERGVTCMPIESLNELEFLWRPEPPVKHWCLSVAAGFVALAVVVFMIFYPPPPPPPPPPADSSIYTAGEKGAYHTWFCPVIAAALSKAQFGGYKCAPSMGTLENINLVLKNPTSVGFVQFDVYTNEAIKRGEEFKRLAVIRDDFACEHLWMVTKNPDLKDYTSVLNNAPRITFILPSEQSGSAATFAFLQANDPNHLGRVPEGKKKLYVANATAVLNEVASGADDTVGFFVQFYDPKNDNIKLMKRKLNIIPVWSEEILHIKRNHKAMYLEQTFEIRWTDGAIGGQWIDDVLRWLGLVKVTEATTACTRVAIITGTPEAVEALDPNKRENHEALIKKIERIGKL